MASLIVISTADRQRANQIQTAVDRGELPAMTLVTKRPSDFQCWQGVYYGGNWYPPSDPRGAELEKLRYMLPAGKTAELPKSPPVMLGQVEIQMGPTEYSRPGITVSHNAQDKKLRTHLYANGRIGKQKNWYPLYLRQLDGDQLELHTGGAKKCIITLADWQAFIDQVEVRVSFISQRTIAFTPQLVKMARDVQARRPNHSR